MREAEARGYEPPVGAEGPILTRSELEDLLLRLCRRHRLPLTEVNVRVAGIEVDFLWRDARLVVEADGYAFHRGRTAFERDRARDLALRLAGFTVIRVSYMQVKAQPAEVASAIRAALTSLGTRLRDA